jgi:hypothetical protein
MTANVSCLHCNGLIVADPRIAGREVGCPHCNGRVIMPAVPAPRAAKPAQLIASGEPPPLPASAIVGEESDWFSQVSAPTPITPSHRQDYVDRDIGFTLRTRNCTLAYVSLGLVCASFVTAGLLLLPGIVCGHIAISQCSHDRHMLGKAYAVAALVVGYIIVGLAAIIIGLLILAAAAGSHGYR